MAFLMSHLMNRKLVPPRYKTNKQTNKQQISVETDHLKLGSEETTEKYFAQL